MKASNPKRPRGEASSSIKTKRPKHKASSSIESPNSLPTASTSKQNPFSSILSSLLSVPSSLSTVSIKRSLDQEVDKALTSVSNDVFDYTSELQSLLLESFKRCGRNRATSHNSRLWPLPQDLTIKMFSMLDAKSLMQAMACCTMFRKCAMEPTCYSNINLTTFAKNIDDGIVCTIIHRAGKELRCLELGDVDPPEIKATKPLLKGGVCLKPLSYNNGFIGKCLKRIHLYNMGFMNVNPSITNLSACSNITDLKIVQWYPPAENLLVSLTTNCRFIEHLFLETYGFPAGPAKSKALVPFLTNLPNLTSLTLKAIRLDDAPVQTIVEGAPKLKYMDLSRNRFITGRFLSGLGDSLKGNSLETLILRDCSSLLEDEVLLFLNSLSTGNFRFRHIDISNNRGLKANDGKSSYKPKVPLKMLRKDRPDVKFVADFRETNSLSREEILARGLKPSANDGTKVVDWNYAEEDHVVDWNDYN